MRRLVPVLLLLLAGCGATPPPVTEAPPPADTPQAAAPDADEAVPTGRLPSDVRPTHYALALRIVPTEERFSGVATIDVVLDRPRSHVWLHARDMNVSEISVVREGAEGVLSARLEPGDTEGTARVVFGQTVPAGTYRMRLVYDAPFDRQLKGLYRVDTEGRAYAFTQFEAISARLAFPCFDEPAFKTPFDVELTVRTEDVAIANTRPVNEEPVEGGFKRIRYATTEPLPTYLVAFAVGPLDVVEAPAIPPNGVRDRPLPLRGVAAHGKGPQLAFALAGTPALVDALERYFGIPYPYDKLDILAVPDFASGAMENAGAITFREWLLLVDPATAPEDEKRAFAGVMAHELAHQWFGNLVTMPWWNDIWLNEAFATWMGNKIHGQVHPDHHTELSMLEGVLGAMGSDSLVNARQIRQPIESNHDIRNAFDGITYQKGGGVLAMFERYVGEDAFRAGIQRYLQRHRFGNATADEFLSDVFEGQDAQLAPAFRTFLEQPGVPLLAMRTDCSGAEPAVAVEQTRFLPAGSTGERARDWDVPLCVRVQPATGAARTVCSLVTERSGRVALGPGACPRWVMPNAEAAGYFRWSLPAEDLTKLRAGFAQLSTREKLSVADALRAGFSSAAMPGADVFAQLETLAQDPSRQVSTALMDLVAFAHDRLVEPADQPRVQAFARRLYAAHLRRLGWTPRPDEDGETRLFRAEVLGFLAFTGRDPAVRREAARRGRAYLGLGGDGALHADAVTPDLVGLCLAVMVQDGDAATFDAVLARYAAATDARARNEALGAASSTLDAARGERVLGLSLDPATRVNETMTPIWIQMSQPETRENTWTWFQAHVEPLFARIATTRGGDTPWLAREFCDATHRDAARAFFAPKIEQLSGGPRNLAGAMEAVDLCIARKTAQEASVRAFFARLPAR